LITHVHGVRFSAGLRISRRIWRVKMLLKDRIALVTGASRGIGAATAEVLAQRGAQVAVSARTLPDLENLVAAIKERGGKALAIHCDVMDVVQVERMIGRVI
jgi:NAD(P)-dependent dehydrogenase (short-subunit alcohol dehydrogenase family)